MNSEKQIARGAFILRGNHLYVANDGHGFDRNGVIALCMPNLSGKGDKIVDDHPDVSDDNWIEALNKTQLNQYINSKNRLQTDSKEEKSTIQQYSGRWILELLQNIDDALGPKEQKKYIGTKGLGFLSVMEVANNPAIFSNGFHFTFSKERNKIALLDKGLDISLAELAPSFQVPWPVKADKFEDGLLKQGFQTVIKLELRPDSIEDVKKSLQFLDHHFLLFSQNLKELQIKVGELSYCYSKYVKVLSEEESSQKCQIKLICTQGEKNCREEDWVLWRRDWDSTETNGRRSSCMFALPSKKGKCVPFKSQTKAYNFYPTEQASRLKGFLHISFDLTRDRKQFLIWGDKQDVSWNGKNCKSENKRLVEETVKLICEDVIQDKDVSAETVLKVFRPLNEFYYETAPNGKPLKKVQIELIEQIRSCSFLPKFGGGECAPDEIKIWKHDFIDCLRENAEIGDWDLAHKDLEPLFEVLKDYDVDELSYGEVLDCLANVAIKNKSAKERTKIAEVISQYCSETAFFSSRAERDFLNIDFLSDTDSNIVSLGSDYFLKDDINPPSFLSVKCLSKRSQQDLKKHFLSLEKCALAKSINEHFISDYVSLFENQFSEFVRSKQNPDFWHDCGYEIIKYAFSYFQSNEIQFKEYIANSDLTFFVPSKGGHLWAPARKSFFSTSWLKSKSLEDWFNSYSDEDEYEIIGKNAFLNKLRDKESTKTKGGSLESILFEFMLSIGVHDTPSLKRAGWDEINNYFEYRKIIDDHRINRMRVDYCFAGVRDYLASFDQKEAIINSNKMLKKAAGRAPQFYVKHNSLATSHPEYFNLATFQILDGKWIKLDKSPLNPSGFFSPKECFLTEDLSPIFPTLSKRKLREYLAEDSKEFIARLKLQDTFSPAPETWCNWIKCLSSGYKELQESGFEQKALNAQVNEFFITFLKKPDVGQLDFESSLVPAKSPLKMNKALEFKNSSSVLLNDTSLEDRELSKELVNFGYSLFILDKASFPVNDLVEKLKLHTVNQKFSINSSVKTLSESDQSHHLEWLEKRWVIFQALDKEFSGNKKTRPLSEVSDKLVVCESIRINIQLKDRDVETESTELSPKFFDDTLNPLTQQKSIFIKYDEGKRYLIEYLCNYFFKWSGRTELVGALMDEPMDIDNIENKLIENNISADLIENFEALHKMQEEAQREAQLVEQKKEEENLKYAMEADERLLDEVHKKFVDAGEGLSKDNAERNVSNKNLKSGEKSISNSNAEQRVSNNKEDVSKKQKTYSKRQRGSFGTRISGHLRARNNNEVVGRTYFDDEDEKNTINRQVGEEAEKIVHSLIVDNFKPDDIQFYGGNNKGFDIDYKLGGETYFVEVKGLVGNWDDSDVLLSKSQFEKAQEEKDKYSIFIVENVGEAENRKIWEIRNPAELFTKMQIDHGWRNFSKSHDNLEPQKGRFLVFGGERHKIIKVKTAGVLVTVFTENSSKPIVFKPHTMSVESECPE